MQWQFREQDLDADGVADFAGGLHELHRAGLIDDVLLSGVKGSYRYAVVGDGETYQARATPIAGATTNRSFFICEDGLVRYSSRGAADATSPSIR